MKINISSNLAYLRKLNHYSIEEIAGEIGVSRQAVSKWETGQSMPDIINCAALAEFYHVSVDDLLYFDGNNSQVGIPPKGQHIFGTVTLEEKGQVTVPKDAIQMLDLKTGDTLLVLGDENPETMGIAFVPAKQFLEKSRKLLECYYPKQNGQKESRKK